MSNKQADGELWVYEGGRGDSVTTLPACAGEDHFGMAVEVSGPDTIRITHPEKGAEGEKYEFKKHRVQ